MRVFDTQQFVEANFDVAEAAVESRTDKVDSDTRFVLALPELSFCRKRVNKRTATAYLAKIKVPAQFLAAHGQVSRSTRPFYHVQFN